jgi:hypothetical protein
MDKSQTEISEAVCNTNRQKIDVVSNLAMKLNESKGELPARITNNMVIIQES